MRTATQGARARADEGSRLTAAGHGRRSDTQCLRANLAPKPLGDMVDPNRRRLWTYLKFILRPSNTSMSHVGYGRKFWGPLTFVRFTPQSRHTEAQCPLLGL